jgi:soluble lytic murein transglycosylase-like protein
MAVQTTTGYRKARRASAPDAVRETDAARGTRKARSKTRQEIVTTRSYEPVKGALIRFLPGWIILAFVLVILLPNALSVTMRAAGRTISAIPRTVGIAPSTGSGVIAPLFSDSVEYWGDHIAAWSARYNVDPNLLATIMQIESCGDANVSSYAGAQGLFQVMPFHFASGENQLDPDTNAMRGANFINECLGWSNGDVGLALACYNGGPSLVNRPYTSWPNQTQRYYQWGTTIYADAQQGKDTSDSLARWLNAGGVSLCNNAARGLGLNG